MKQYPPSADDVLEAFRLWYNTTRNCEYRLDHRPDEVERTKREIDVVLIADGAQPMAVEISSIWRSEKAGKEDAYCGTWFDEVQGAVRGRVKGTFRVRVPLRIRKGVTADHFADALTNLIVHRASEMTDLMKQSKGVVDTLAGMKVMVAMASDEGSDLSFGRLLEHSNEFPGEVTRIVRERSPKLKHHKDAGRETWLVLYNTFWTALPDHVVRQAINDAIGAEYDYIDHVAVIEGNPPEDSWIEQVR